MKEKIAIIGAGNVYEITIYIEGWKKRMDSSDHNFSIVVKK